MRSFALTLHFHKPSAFKFVRKKFNNHLPDPSTMRSWFSNSTGFGEPGINQEALKMISSLSTDLKQKGKSLCVSIAMDEMHIRKHVLWNEAKNKFFGFINFGDKEKNGALPVANQALTFLLTGINVELSIPIAHFIKKLSASHKAFLLNEVIKEVTNHGARVVDVVMDGIPNNFAGWKVDYFDLIK